MCQFRLQLNDDEHLRIFFSVGGRGLLLVTMGAASMIGAHFITSYEYDKFVGRSIRQFAKEA